MEDTEYLVACALIRDGEIHSRGFKEHWRIRAALGDSDPCTTNPEDEMGFLTSKGRFLNRIAARFIGAESGQCSPSSRELLSSEVDYWEPPCREIEAQSKLNESVMSRQVRRVQSRKGRT